MLLLISFCEMNREKVFGRCKVDISKQVLRFSLLFFSSFLASLVLDVKIINHRFFFNCL